jgi:hypothetical protein
MNKLGAYYWLYNGGWISQWKLGDSKFNIQEPTFEDKVKAWRIIDWKKTIGCLQIWRNSRWRLLKTLMQHQIFFLDQLKQVPEEKLQFIWVSRDIVLQIKDIFKLQDKDFKFPHLPAN